MIEKAVMSPKLRKNYETPSFYKTKKTYAIP